MYVWNVLPASIVSFSPRIVYNKDNAALYVFFLFSRQKPFTEIEN